MKKHAWTPLRWKDWERFCGFRGQQRKQMSSWSKEGTATCTFKAKKTPSMNEVNARGAWQTEQQCSVAVTSSSSTMTYLAQYMMYLPSRAEQTPAEFWRQRDNGSVIPLVALDLISAPASQAFVERLFSVCGMLTTGRRNRMRKSLHMRSWLKVNYNEICDLQ